MSEMRSMVVFSSASSKSRIFPPLVPMVTWRELSQSWQSMEWCSAFWNPNCLRTPSVRRHIYILLENGYIVNLSSYFFYTRPVFFNLFWFMAPLRSLKNLAAPLMDWKWQFCNTICNKTLIIPNLAAPLTPLCGTLVCHGTPVGNHCTRLFIYWDLNFEVLILKSRRALTHKGKFKIT